MSGQNLDWFWRSWYYETWTLDQAVGGVRVDDDRSIVIVEDQGRMPMPVPLTVACRGGEVVERTIPVDAWLAGRSRTSIEVDCAATAVTIDAARDYPDVDRSNNAGEEGPPTL